MSACVSFKELSSGGHKAKEGGAQSPGRPQQVVGGRDWGRLSVLNP